MKKTIGFLIALVLFGITALGLHTLVNDAPKFDPHSFGGWVNQNKIFAGDVIKENINDDTMVVMGSSEFRHGRDMETHPINQFADNDLNMMMIGEGYYQSLFHAVELGALEDGIKNNKVALILSPQWFRKSGVLPSAYASRFPEMNFVSMLRDSKVSDKTKRYIMDRTKELLVGDPATLERVKKYERIYLLGTGTRKEKKSLRMHYKFAKEKSKMSIFAFSKVGNIKRYDPDKVTKDVEPDWKKALEWADAAGKKEANNNPFYIGNNVYRLQISPVLNKRKNSAMNGSYADSKEYDDLRCFLEVCKDTGIKPMLIMTPVNGYWYDYTGFPKEGRERYYEKVRKMASEYNAELADLSNHEYTKYFFLDRVHFGWKGWVYINENVYNFARKS